MSTVDVPGATLYYETLGSGPLLVMIPGAGGTADVFRGLAGHLADRYTTLVYDRRGFSRSRPHEHPDDRLATDADDVRRLVEHVSDGPATIFGASSGAIVGLATLDRHPSVVDTLVAYEPPVMRLLPDGSRWLDFFAGLYDQYRQVGAERAVTSFRERTFPAADLAVMARAPRDEANATFWFEHELRQYPQVAFDLTTLAAERVVPAVGRDGAGYPCHDATLALGARLDRPVLRLPGGHVGFVAHPEEFARDLTSALRRRPDHRRGTRTAADWDSVYASAPRWDIGRPQPAFQALADKGAIRGRVLDVGCGTGEHVLMAAGLGLDATGIDLAPRALHAAGVKAQQRGLTARFLRHDVRDLADLDERFDTVLDCGLFHVFDERDRAAFVNSVRAALRPGGRYFMLSFRDERSDSPDQLRVSRQDIVATFTGGWRVDTLEPTTLDSLVDPDGLPAWLVAVTRT